MINENIKKFLRQELGFTNANQIKSIYGITDKEKAYELLYKDYLKEINKQKNIQKKEKIEKEIKQFKEDVKKSAKEKLNKMKEKKSKDTENKQEKLLQQKLLDMRKDGTKFITIELNKYKSIEKALNVAIKNFEKVFPDKKYNIVINDKRYAVNEMTKQNLLDNIKKSLLILEEEQGSDAETAIQIIKLKKIQIEIFEPTNKYKKSNGAFFKYLHNTKLDLSRYQIYNKLIDLYDNCFIYSLKMGGLCDDKIKELSLKCKSKNIPRCEFENICKFLEIKINLKKIKKENESHIEVFGKEFKEEYNIGLLDEHYFINEKTDITLFALKNYFELQNEKEFNYIIEQNGNYYKRNKNSCIDSFKLIKFMLDNKDKYLKPINKLDIFYTQNYKNVDDKIIDLNYVPKENFNYRKIESKNNKEKIKYDNIFFDFETYTNDDDKHIPYLCCYIDDNNNNKSFYGEDCGLQMLSHLSKNFKNIRMIAHNSSYDIRFLYKYLYNIEEITKGTKVISCKCKFNNLNIQIKDSLLLISMPLKKFPKTFKIMNTEKEVISYKMYNETNCLNERFINIDDAIKYIEKEYKDVKQFLENIEKWNLKVLNKYDCIEYSKKYCEIDCYILKEGYNIFKKWMQELCNINIDEILTIASLAHKYFIEQGCYKDVNEISTTPQNFIQKCVVGGRVMCSQNKKNIVTNKKIMDFDAVSLYPSAMSRMDGFLKGLPKVITNLDFNDIKNKDGYFVEIIIKSVGINRKFPLMSYINEKGIRIFTNDMVGRKIYVDKISLEDMIKFQNITFDVIRGYYFDEGFNTTINDVIKKIFNERVNLKKQKNPAEIVYKLIMNSGYGKSIMKEIETETLYFNNEDEMKVFISRNYNWLIEYEQIYESNLFKVKLIKPLTSHFNIAQVGVSILSWSKRIMNEVMCLAEDNKLNIYYQDTDSMHIEESDIEILNKKFKETYNKELIGEQLGQFHSDFDLEGCKNIYARRSIFLGKKCYIDELEGENEKGEKKIDYHIRLKGIPNSCIIWTSKKLGYNNVFELYEDMYKGKSINFDLTQNGEKDNFKFNKNGCVETLQEFKRIIKFN